MDLDAENIRIVAGRTLTRVMDGTVRVRADWLFSGRLQLAFSYRASLVLVQAFCGSGFSREFFPHAPAT